MEEMVLVEPVEIATTSPPQSYTEAGLQLPDHNIHMMLVVNLTPLRLWSLRVALIKCRHIHTHAAPE